MLMITANGACVVGDVRPIKDNTPGPVEPSGVWCGPAISDHAISPEIAPQPPRLIFGAAENVLNGHSCGFSLPPGCKS